MYIGSMARQSQPLLKHLGGTHQAIEIAIEGLLNSELKVNLRKSLRQGRITSFEHCLAQVEDLQDTLGLEKMIENKSLWCKQGQLYENKLIMTLKTSKFAVYVSTTQGLLQDKEQQTNKNQIMQIHIRNYFHANTIFSMQIQFFERQRFVDQGCV